MSATFGPRIRRVVAVALLAAGATLIGASAAQAHVAQAADFSWTSTPDDFSWTSTPNDFSWT
ncbi:MAG TPA: hypothetical protein VFX61_06510 [Micromonosporaceae bacterium]|nr:hypothetical protein [Micromonosporaceae bacterium]